MSWHGMTALFYELLIQISCRVSTLFIHDQTPSRKEVRIDIDWSAIHHESVLSYIN
jgi:hypothetical protein